MRVVNQVKDIDLDDGVSFEVKDVSNIMDYDVKDLSTAYAKRRLDELESLLDKLGWEKE